MFRLLGFCIGSLASLGALFLVIGTPEFHLGDDEADRARFDEAVEKLRSRQAMRQPDESPITEAPEPVEAVADVAPPVAIDPFDVEETVVAPGEASSQASDDLPGGEAVSNDYPISNDSVPTSNQVASGTWHSFWTPFRSRIAAQGFVGRLENVTGLDYRIVSAGKDGYLVEFSYGDDTELDSKLERISAATGLELSRGLP